MNDNLNTIKRVDALEVHIAHQNKLIDGLSEMSIKQWNEIKILNYHLAYLKNKILELENETDDFIDEESTPPHF